MRALAARRRFEATRSVFILAILTVVSPCAGADSHLPEKVLARAQALDRIVQEQLELVRLNLESGTLNRERAAGDLERLDANLAALGDAVRGLPPDERERLEAKLHVLSVHSACPGTVANELECNDDIQGLQSGVSLAVVAGYQYLIRLAGMNGVVGLYRLSVDIPGIVSGAMVRADDGEPMRGYVDVWTVTGSSYGFEYTDSGSYEVDWLPSGTYFLSTRGLGPHGTGVLDKLWDDIPCLDGPPDGCDPVKGTPVPVVQGATTRFVDFSLRPWGGEGITGRVTDQTLGGPLGGVVVDLWDGFGQWRAAVSTGPTGIYVVELPPGTYRVSTDNALGYLNEVFDDIACPGGSAYSGACDPLGGNPVGVSTGMNTQAVDFALEALFLFLDGFEGGTTSAWSLTVP